MMLATLGPPTKAPTPSASMPLFHSGRLCYWMAVKSTDLDKWRMADRAARRGSQLAMSSNGFNTRTPHSPSSPSLTNIHLLCFSCFVFHCTGVWSLGWTLQPPTKKNVDFHILCLKQYIQFKREDNSSNPPLNDGNRGKRCGGEAGSNGLCLNPTQREFPPCRPRVLGSGDHLVGLSVGANYHRKKTTEHGRLCSGYIHCTL